MSILPKGNPQRLFSEDLSQDPSLDPHLFESTVDYRHGKSVSAGAVILRNLDKLIVVFSWAVEGIDPSAHHNNLAPNR